MISNFFTGGFLLLLLIAPVRAAPVYSWTDAQGVTHFSETPPDDAQIESSVLEVEPAPVAGPSIADDYYSVANQAARMEARRLEQERLRAEILRAEAEARRADADAAAAAREQAEAAADARDIRYYPLYPYYPNYGYRRYPYHRDHPRFPPPRPHPPPKRNKKLVVEPATP